MVFTYAWDFEANLFSEDIRTTTSIVYQKVASGKTSTATVFAGGKCSKAKDASNWSASIRDFYSIFAISEGLVSDPFITDNKA